MRKSILGGDGGCLKVVKMGGGSVVRWDAQYAKMTKGG